MLTQIAEDVFGSIEPLPQVQTANAELLNRVDNLERENGRLTDALGDVESGQSTIRQLESDLAQTRETLSTVEASRKYSSERRANLQQERSKLGNGSAVQPDWGELVRESVRERGRQDRRSWSDRQDRRRPLAETFDCEVGTSHRCSGPSGGPCQTNRHVSGSAVGS